MPEFTFDGRSIPVRPGQTVAGALWQAGIRSWRTTRVNEAPRGLFCGIGACFDCLATIDGETGQRACLAPARPGSVVTSAAPTAEVPPTAETGLRAETPPTPETSPTLVGSTDRSGGGDGGRFDVIVVGAGPAGLAAAATAALAGARVVLLDAARQPGGQFWRYRDGFRPEYGKMRDGSVLAGLTSIVEERVDYVSGATVWFAEPGFTLHTTAGRFTGKRVVLATGAYDRALPFPGWDLPGVLTPGGAQALLKGSGVVAGRAVVVAGAGPFLLPVAVGLAAAGASVVGVFEAGDPRRYAAQARALPALAGKLGEATGYLAALARYRVPYRIRHAVVAAHASARRTIGGVDPTSSGQSGAGQPGAGQSGVSQSALGRSGLGGSGMGWSALGWDGTDRPGSAHGGPRVSSVDIARLDEHGQIVAGSTRRLSCDAVAVGYGFTANLELALTLGCSTGIAADGGLSVTVGPHGETSVDGVYAAGEITGVGGARLAVVEGQLAGAAAARSSGTTTRNALSARDTMALLRRQRRLRTFADAMHGAHRPPAGWTGWPREQTLLCRCEEVTRQTVADAVTELGASDTRSVKLLTRAGMGWCQGRQCGYAVAAITARLAGREVTAEDLLTFAARPLATPVRLADLASSAESSGSASPADPKPVIP